MKSQKYSSMSDHQQLTQSAIQSVIQSSKSVTKEIYFKNKKLSYRSIGSGKTVVLLHGFGEDSEVWKNQVEYLKEKFHLIIPDLPGSGKSSLDNRQITIEDYSEAIRDVIDREGIEKTTLIGHSMGGYITLAFAEKFPARLNAFGLFHSTAFADSDEKKSTRRKGIDFIKEHGALEFLKTSTPNLFSSATKENNPALIEEQMKLLSNFSGEALVSYNQAMIDRPDRTEVLKNVKIPILFVFGEHDTAVPLSDGLKQCHLPEKSYIHILKNSGHLGMLEEADESNLILEEFLQQS